MKKIISIVTLLAVVVCMLASCSAGVDSVISCYESSYPHKIVVETEQIFGDKGLYSVSTLIRGTESGKEQSVMTLEETELRTVEEGSGKVIYSPEKSTNIITHYREGYGVREKDVLDTNKWSSWNKKGKNFFPERGELGLTLTTSAMTNINFADNTLSFVVKAGQATAIFGEDADIQSDVNVTITTDGVVVTGVLIEYTVPADAANNVSEMSVTIKATYSYSKEQINIEG